MTQHAKKRYIYAWGDGRAEGDASMRDLLGGKGAGLAEMTTAGLPAPPGFTITTEACNDYFAAGEQLPDGLWEDVLAAVARGGAEHRQGLRRSGQPAARQRPIRGQVLHARDDGHGPQPRPQRGRRSTA
ncbi:MAG: PEP/pyruvate-binding domain-containing protein [Candidatus Limnocylindrales bacterium]